MKSSGLPKVLIAILSIAVLFLIVIYILLVTDRIDLSFFKNTIVSNNLVFSEKYENIYDEISIDSEASDIELKKSNTNNIEIKIYGDKDKINVQVSDNEIKIKADSKKCHGICINRLINKVVVALPEENKNSITIDNKYGDITSNDLIINNIKVYSDYGDIKLYKVNNINVDTNYGDIKINSINNKMDIKTGFGDIKIDKVNILENSNLFTNYGDIKIESTNEVYIYGKTNFGDTKINNIYREKEIELKLITNFGDIKVNN